MPALHENLTQIWKVEGFCFRHILLYCTLLYYALFCSLLYSTLLCLYCTLFSLLHCILFYPTLLLSSLFFLLLSALLDLLLSTLLYIYSSIIVRFQILSVHLISAFSNTAVKVRMSQQHGSKQQPCDLSWRFSCLSHYYPSFLCLSL